MQALIRATSWLVMPGYRLSLEIDSNAISTVSWQRKNLGLRAAKGYFSEAIRYQIRPCRIGAVQYGPTLYVGPNVQQGSKMSPRPYEAGRLQSLADAPTSLSKLEKTRCDASYRESVMEAVNAQYYVNEYQSAAIDAYQTSSPRSQRNSVLSRHPRYVRSTTKFFANCPWDELVA